MASSLLLQQLPILILISFDGFRHDYVDPDIAPNLFLLSKRATIGHMESLFITKTFPNHFSMVTGLYEDEHEIINNQMFDPHLNATFKPGVDAREWWDSDGLRIPIWTANELFGGIKSDGKKRFSGSMMFPGSTTPYVNILPTYLQNYDTVRNWTNNVDTVISWLTHPDQPASLVCMYFDDPDTTAHQNGPWSQVTLDAVRRVDSAAGYIMKRLKDVNLIHRTNVIFVSDHGMAEVQNVTYLEDYIDTNNFDMYGSTPDWSVFVKPGKSDLKNKIFRELLSISERCHFKIYKRSKIPAEYHYSKSQRIGDFFILVDEHHDLFMRRSVQARKLPQTWGNHGWKPSDKDMRPLFLAIGPSFKERYNHNEIFPNIDLFPLMVHLLDLPSEMLPNNGSLARIADIIRLDK